MLNTRQFNSTEFYRGRIAHASQLSFRACEEMLAMVQRAVIFDIHVLITDVPILLREIEQAHFKNLEDCYNERKCY